MAVTTDQKDVPNRPRQRRFYDRYIQHAQHTGSKVWDNANRLTNGFVAYLAQAIKNFLTKGTTEAVVFGYWSVFSLFPLVMLAVVIGTFALGPDEAKAQVYNTLNRFIPGGGSILIRDNIDQAISQRGGFGLIGIISLAYGAVGLFRNLQANLSRIFRDKQPRNPVEQIVVGLMMMIVLVGLAIFSIVISVLFAAIGTRIVGPESSILHIGGTLIPLAINTLMFYLLFRFIPRRNISSRALWPAALFAAIGWELTKRFFGWYAANLANYGVVYGSLGTVIGLLTWTYLTGCFISLCAEIAVATDDWLTKRPPAVAITPETTNKPADQVAPDAPELVVKPNVLAKDIKVPNQTAT
jgi:membrane protein